MRVCLVTLKGNGQFEMTQSKYRLTEEQKQGDGQALFDFCAECLKTFIEGNFDEEERQKGLHLPLGFTFSYPCIQVRLPSHTLLKCFTELRD